MAEKERIDRAYKAVMSRGDDVQLDPSEVALLMRGAEEGSIVRVKRGIINPSFLISIVEDKSREPRYTSGFAHERKSLGMIPLKDIFNDVPQLGPAKHG
jgi:hypothetical protein